MSTESVTEITSLSDSHESQALPTAGLSSPPDSNNAIKLDGSDSELSDIEDPEEEDIGEILPDHYEGGVPVFTPTMEQFKSFQHYVSLL